MQMQHQHAIHLQQRQQQQMSPRLTPTPPNSTSPVPSEYCVPTSSHYSVLGNESGLILSQHLQQLQLQQQQQQQPLLQSFNPSSPLHNSNCNASPGHIVPGTSRPTMGSIVQGTPIVSQLPLIPTPASRGYYGVENSPNVAAAGASGALPRAQPGSIMQGTPYNILPVLPNNLDNFSKPSPSTLVPIASFGGGGSIMQGTPINRTGVSDVEDMEATDGISIEANIGDNCADSANEEALDLSVNKSFSNRTLENKWALRQSDQHPSRFGEQPSTLSATPHPQISVTDTEGDEVTGMWNVYAHVAGQEGTCRNSRVSAFAAPGEADLFSSEIVRSELHKSSSGSIEVQLSSDCSQLTVAQIFALIQQSIHTKASGLVSCQMEDVTGEERQTALLLERPGEDIHIAVEVSSPTGPEGLKGLKIRRISGDFLRYDRICNELIACISM